MSEFVEFENLDQLKTLLRAGIDYKFNVSDDPDLLNGSPIYASALNDVRKSLISGLRSSSTPERAQVQDEWYQLAGHPNLWDMIAERASLHPRWHGLSVVEARHWIETLASPLVVDDETFEVIKGEVEKIL